MPQGTGPEELVRVHKTMDKGVYADILKKNLEKSTQSLQMEEQFVFMHNNDPKHTSTLTYVWLEGTRVEVLGWPNGEARPQSDGEVMEGAEDPRP